MIPLKLSAKILYIPDKSEERYTLLKLFLVYIDQK